MTPLEEEFWQDYTKLLPEARAEVRRLAYALGDPAFKAKLCALTPAGKRLPPLEAIKTLLDEWGGNGHQQGDF